MTTDLSNRALSATAALNALLATAGWEVEFAELDATCAKATLRAKRIDGRWIHLSVDRRGGNVERWVMGMVREPYGGKKGDVKVDRIVDTFLGREKHRTPLAALAGFCAYLEDNPAPGRQALVGAPIRVLLAPLLPPPAPPSLGSPTLDAALATILEGHVLHVRADRLPGRRRHPSRDARPPVDLTLGPDAHGAFLVVDYSRRPNGDEERYEDARHAVKAVWGQLGAERERALRVALRKVHGEVEKVPSRFIEESRVIAAGARLRGAYGHKPGITGPLFGPSGHGRV